MKQNTAIIGGQCAGKTTIANMLGGEIVKFAEPHYRINALLAVEKNRAFMQAVTDVIKTHWGNDIFVKLFENKYKDVKYGLINDDCRYKLELDLLKRLGWRTIYVWAPEEERQERSEKQGLQFLSTHNSETEVLSLYKYCDVIINNDKSISVLQQTVRALI